MEGKENAMRKGGFGMAFFVWLFVLLSILSAALFTRVAYIGRPFGKLCTKTLASLCFLVVGILCASASPLGSGRAFYAVLMLIGLFCGLVGDVSLAYQEVFPRKKERYFLLGLGAFFLGHLSYIATFAFLPQAGALWLLVAALLFLALLCAQRFFKVELGNMRLPVYLYAATISLMAGLACGTAVGAQNLQGWLVCIAAWLFVFSDGVLALLYFGRPRGRWLTAANLGSYYLAQLLLALSIWLR